MNMLERLWESETNKFDELRKINPDIQWQSISFRARLSSGVLVKFCVERYDKEMECFVVRFANAVDGKFSDVEEYLNESHIVSLSIPTDRPQSVTHSPGVKRVRKDGHRDRIMGVTTLPGT